VLFFVHDYNATSKVVEIIFARPILAIYYYCWHILLNEIILNTCLVIIQCGTSLGGDGSFRFSQAL
jgi:hypothetical protein